MKEQEQYDNAILTVRFTGATIDEQGVSIYDLAETLSAIQRIVNKAHLSKRGRLRRGASPSKGERTELSLSIGERRRNSDAFALVPLLTDPATLQYMTTLADYVVQGMVAYAVQNVMTRVRGQPEDESDEQPSSSQPPPNFTVSIHADVVNIVERINASGGVETILVGAPSQPTPPPVVDFNEENKEYVRGLAEEYVLGPRRTIKGDVYRLYPRSNLVTIRRSTTGRKVNVRLSQSDFDEIRYHEADEGEELTVEFNGHPRYKFGVESQAITDFDADAIGINV